MSDFSKRTFIQVPVIERTNKEGAVKQLISIDKINQAFGVYKATTKAIEKIITKYPQTKNFHILEVGCGSGEGLRKLADWSAQHSLKVTLIGMDPDPLAIEFAKKESVAYANIRFENLALEDINEQVDIVVCTNYFRRFQEGLILSKMKKCWSLAQIGTVINEWQRTPMALRLGKLFSRYILKDRELEKVLESYIHQSFSRKEMLQLMNEAAFRNPSVHNELLYRQVGTADKIEEALI